MSFCTQQVLVLASGIYDSINSPSSLSVGYISGWITSSGGMLGELNNRLCTSFHLTGSDPCICGGFGDTESVIAGLCFQHDYWRRQGMQTLAGGSLLWTSIAEGDSRLARANPAEIARAYNAMAKDLQEDIHIAVANYMRGHTMAVTVDSAQAAAWPTP